MGLLVQDSFSLLAYTNPHSSPVGYLLDPIQREPVCAALNSAILGMYVMICVCEEGEGREGGGVANCLLSVQNPSIFQASLHWSLHWARRYSVSSTCHGMDWGLQPLLEYRT